jgi:hypothetical protein
MRRRLTILMCILAGALAPNANAANILLQSANESDQNTGVATTEDAPLFSFLTGLGHNVTIRPTGTGAAPTAAELAGINLIVVSRNVSSGDYDDGTEPQDWNGLNTPMLLLMAHVARSSHWGWFSGTNLPSDQVGAVNAALLPSHPFLAGVSGTNWYPTGARLDFSSDPFVGSSIATYTAGANIGTILGDIPAGTALNNAKGTTGARRALFVMNDYPDVDGSSTTNGQQWGLDASGQRIMQNIIGELIPEPSAVMLFAIGIAGLIGFIVRRGS